MIAVTIKTDFTFTGYFTMYQTPFKHFICVRKFHKASEQVLLSLLAPPPHFIDERTEPERSRLSQDYATSNDGARI